MYSILHETNYVLFCFVFFLFKMKSEAKNMYKIVRYKFEFE